MLWGCVGLKSETHPHLQMLPTSQLKVPDPINKKDLTYAVPTTLSLSQLSSVWSQDDTRTLENC